MDDETKENGWELWASVTTDGIPENAAMESLLTGQVQGAMAFPFAFVVTNDSQSMVSATNMTESHSNWVTLGAWVVTGVVVGASVMAGYWFLPPLPHYWLSALRAFAGGAILASLAGGIIPTRTRTRGRTSRSRPRSASSARSCCSRSGVPPVGPGCLGTATAVQESESTDRPTAFASASSASERP